MLRGFTLIELLVVIAIIAVLMGILVPVLRKTKEQGKDVVCRNNMKQIGLAANLYSEAWDFYVPWGLTRRSPPRRLPWFELFMPFLAQRPINNDYRNVKLYRCPSYPNRQQTICYVVNGWTFDNRNDLVGRERIDPLKLTECTRRAYTIYLADNEDGHWRFIIKRADDPGVNRCDVWNPGHLPTSDGEDVTYGRRVARARHKNGCNYLYLDWHVDWMSTEKLQELHRINPAVVINMWRYER